MLDGDDGSVTPQDIQKPAQLMTVELKGLTVQLEYFDRLVLG